MSITDLGGLERRRAIEHDEQDCSKREEVTALNIVDMSRVLLRSHVTVSTHIHVVLLVALALDFMGQSKVDQLEVATLGHDNVLELQVTVSNLLLVSVSQAIQKLLEVEPTGLLRKVVDSLKHTVEVDFALLEDDDIMFLSFGICVVDPQSGSGKNVDKPNDVGMGSHRLHHVGLSNELAALVEDLEDHRAVMFVKGLTDVGLGSSFLRAKDAVFTDGGFELGCLVSQWDRLHFWFGVLHF